jgi:curved DNA-binding protein CbpA
MWLTRVSPREQLTPDNRQSATDNFTTDHPQIRCAMIRAAGSSATLFLHMNGRLSQHPLTELLREINDAGLSGALRLTRDRVKAVIYAERGEIVYARSNLRAHRLDECARRSKMVGDARLSEVVTEMMSDTEVAAALVKSGALNEDGLARLRTFQVLNTLRSLLPLTDGEWNFDTRARLADDARVRFDLRQLLLEGARHLPAEFAANRFNDYTELISPAPAQPVHLQLLPAEAFILSRADAPAPLGELLSLSGMSEAETLQAIYALALCGFLARARWRRVLGTNKRAPDATAEDGRAADDDGADETAADAVATNDDAPDAPAQTEVPAEPDPLEEIAALVACAAAADYYEMLGVARDAGVPEVKRAYYALARRFHPDRFRRAADAETLARVEDAFAEIAHAYETLRDPRLRATYDSKLGAHTVAPTAPAGAPQARRGAGVNDEKYQPRHQATSEGTPQYRAEEKFQQGLVALQGGDAAAATLHFGEAVRLSPRQARYHALYGRALMASAQTRRQAETELRAAITLDPRNAAYHVALAELYDIVGLPRRAEGELERALALDPRHAAARQMLERMKGKG